MRQGRASARVASGLRAHGLLPTQVFKLIYCLLENMGTGQVQPGLRPWCSTGRPRQPVPGLRAGGAARCRQRGRAGPIGPSGQGTAHDLREAPGGPGPCLRRILQSRLGPFPDQRLLQFGLKKQTVTWQREQGSKGLGTVGGARAPGGWRAWPGAPPGQSAVSLKARFLQQLRHRLNTHLLPWAQDSQ